MAQPTGVRFTPERRRELAIKAAQLKDQNWIPLKIANELDVSEPTARNLIRYGYRIRDEAKAKTG